MAAALQFDPPSHTYLLDGIGVPSVTQILRASGLIDFSSVPPTVLERARVRGTVVHQAIHYFNERDLDVEQFCQQFPDYAGYLRAWISFTDRQHFVPKFSEYRVASRRHQVAGTIDCLGVLHSQGALLDFATGRPDDVSKDLQTAAYHGLAREWAAEDPALATFLALHPIVRRYAIALKADGTFSVHAYADASDWRTFTTLLDAQKIVMARRGEPWSEAA
jgi:hypothetical protein